MDSLNFDNVKILYDSDKVNQKICRKKDKQVTIACILLIIIMLLSCGCIATIISSFTLESAGVFF